MLRNILSVIVGLVVSFIVIVVGEGITHNIFPLPTTVNINDPESIKTYITTAPASFHLAILIIYALASLLGSFIAAIVALGNKMSRAITVGGILMGLGIFNLVSLSHPVWAIVCGLFVFIPFAYLGGFVGIKISSKKE